VTKYAARNCNYTVFLLIALLSSPMQTMAQSASDLNRNLEICLAGRYPSLATRTGLMTVSGERSAKRKENPISMCVSPASTKLFAISLS
jgi:hypothetical protein